MEGSTFSMVFNSDIRRVKQIVNEAIVFIEDTCEGVTNDVVFEFKLMISELLLNAVQHGNDEDERKKVSINIEPAPPGNSVLIRVKDEGPGFNPAKVAKRCASEEGLMDEHGRGIQLVHSLADEVRYNDCGNEISIYKRVGTNG